jgi:hypothetical protein
MALGSRKDALYINGRKERHFIEGSTTTLEEIE